MKIIKDIRLYKSEYGNPMTNPVADKKLNAIVHRIVMKLRESGFSLGNFDHLYINFLTFDKTEKMELSEEIDRYHPWYRNCFVSIKKELYDSIGTLDTYEHIISTITKVLTTYFVADDFDEAFIHSCVSQAVEQGESMLMKFKEKRSANRKAVVFLRYLDECVYHPLLRVYDKDDTMLFQKGLPKTVALDYLGKIQLSSKRIIIQPRKNAFTAQEKEIVFEY